jgi:tripartite-type tricarboxylate transporter receptor subunit TctC
MRLVSIVIIANVLAAASALAQQPVWTKPIRVIATVSAGDGTDLVLRKAGEQLAVRLGQPWIVENRASAGGVIAAEACARAAGDGHVICQMNPSALSFNPHLFARPSYDAERDFRPVTNMYFLAGGVFARAGMGVESMKQLQATALQNPGKIDFGTLGPNVSVDVFRMWLNDQWKTEIVGIPYKGSGNMITALAAGEVHATWIGLYSTLGQIKAGKLRLLAVDTPRRVPQFPDVPTLQETGLPESPMPTWHGLVVPGSTPEAMVRRFNGELVRLFAQPDFEEFFVSRMLQNATSSPEEFAAFLRKDRERAGDVVRRFNIPRQ